MAVQGHQGAASRRTFRRVELHRRDGLRAVARRLVSALGAARRQGRRDRDERSGRFSGRWMAWELYQGRSGVDSACIQSWWAG
jgi:hypothetical protein